MLTALLLVALCQESPAPAATIDPKWERMDYGPFLTTALSMPWPKGAVTPKGIVVKLGTGAACFDTDLLRYAAAWNRHEKVSGFAGRGALLGQ